MTEEKTAAAPRVARFTSLAQKMPKSAILIAERQVICPTPVTANFIMDSITALLGMYYIFNVHYLNKIPLSTTSIVRFLSLSKIALKHCIIVPVIVTNLGLFSTSVHLRAVPFAVIQRLTVSAIPKGKLGSRYRVIWHYSS